MIRFLIIVFCIGNLNAQSQPYNLVVNGSDIDLQDALDSLTENNPEILTNRKAVDFILKNEVRKQFIQDFFDSGFLKNLPSHPTLSDDEAYSLAKRELIFTGRVLEKKALTESECTYLKTQYTIVIDELIFSFYPYTVGDTILLSTIAGKLGKCDSVLPKAHLGVLGSPKYEIGDSKLFALSNVTYYSSLMTNPDFGPNKRYKDRIDPNIFIDYNSGLHLNSKDKIMAIKSYMNKIYRLDENK